MDEETKKEIEIKNIIDIFLEGLRIDNQISDNISSESNLLLSEEDVNVEHLEYRNPEFGSKIIKKFREILHKEIRDWTIQPLQKKQTLFNRKTNENLSFIISQFQSNQKNIDLINEKVDSNQDTIRSVNEKVDSVNEKVDSNQDTIRSVNEKVDSNQDTIRSVNEKVDSNQDTIRSVNEKVDSNQDTIRSVNEKVDSNQDTIRSVNEKVDSVNEKVDSVNEKVDSVNEKVDSNQDTIRSVNEKVNDITLTLEQTLEKMIEEKFISLRETFEIESVVKQKFLEILKRYPRNEDLNYFVNEIKGGKTNVSDFELRLRNTPEFKDLRLLEHCCIYTKFGTKMYLNKNDNVISKDLAIKQIWEPIETEILRNSIKPGMNVVDIGSNIGYYTLLFSKWVGENGQVFSFEPESENFEILQKNMIANQIKNAKSFQLAVSNRNESRFLFLVRENKGDHKIIDLKEGENLEKTKVECITLDSSEVSKVPIDLIKMDIQGAEMLALEGMDKILKENPKIIIFTEFWPYGIEKSGFSPIEFFKKLVSLEFKVFEIKDEELVPITKDFVLFTKYKKNEYVNLLCKR